ncbi:5865_t:CDS:1, partial [Gigaspora rosea]
ASSLSVDFSSIPYQTQLQYRLKKHFFYFLPTTMTPEMKEKE